ncbi:peptide ABC transporter substrate-binding protein [Brevibacillus ginsengisoli]|uniref:peptide ABC transporter substrate-binding protein n=1 Tax=Brevibacillus ginsengisoli TaxID=363854 RepID=UPI003CE7CBFA
MKKYSKGIFALLSSTLVLGAALAGCSGNTAAPTTQKNTEPTANQGATSSQKVFRANLHSEPPTADPGIAEDSTSGVLVRAAFDGLTRLDKDAKPVKSVAQDFKVSADQKTYTFTLRDSKWSNGDPVTAHDFEYAWKRALDPKTASNYAYQLFYIKNGEKANKGEVGLDQVGVKALDDKTLQVELENPTPFFLELTSFYTYAPVDKKIVATNPKWATEAKTIVGNGPFKFDTWDHKNKIILTKNENYWDKDAVKLDRIELSMIEDENTELSMFDNGELDWAGAPMSSLPLDAVQSLKDSGKFKSYVSVSTYMFKMNSEKKPFDNPKIRKAFAYAINRKEITDGVLQQGQIPATGFVPPSMSLNPNGYFKDNDVETAKKLLAEGMKEAGITKLPPITFSYNNKGENGKIAEAVQDQWRKALGVDVKLEAKEWKVFIEDLHQGNFQIARMTWVGDFNDPVNFLEVFKDKKGGNNDTLWEDPKYKDLLNQSAKETDPAKRKELMKQAESILMDQMPMTPIYYRTEAYVQNDKVKDVALDPLGNIDFKWATIEP